MFLCEGTPTPPSRAIGPNTTCSFCRHWQTVAAVPQLRCLTCGRAEGCERPSTKQGMQREREVLPLI